MVVTMRSVLSEATFRKAEPEVEVGEDLLDRPVRWAFASERRDVASFLSGGELVLVDGRRLADAGQHLGAAKYMESLADAGVAAVAVELSEGNGKVPPAAVEAAARRGLIVIGLHMRVPFVDICQAVNTTIVHDQMKMQTDMDMMSTRLRDALAQTHDAQDIAMALSSQLSEEVVLFDADGLPVGRAGRPFEPGEQTAIIALGSDSRPLGAMEITQRAMPLSVQARHIVAEAVSPMAALSMDGGTRMGMIAHLVRGPSDGTRCSVAEAKQAHETLLALGCAPSCVAMPFALRCSSLSSAAKTVSTVIEGFESGEGCEVICLLHGDTFVGCLAGEDAGQGVRAFSRRCHDALDAVRGRDDVQAVHGKVCTDAAMLVDDFGALHDALDMEPPSYGTVAAASDAMFALMTSSPGAEGVIETFVRRVLGPEILESPHLIDAMCACFDALDNKSDACAKLGVQRQTLYNRLDKAEQTIGVSHEDRRAWATALCAAKFAQARALRHL